MKQIWHEKDAKGNTEVNSRYCAPSTSGSFGGYECAPNLLSCGLVQWKCNWYFVFETVKCYGSYSYIGTTHLGTHT
jgi:hypothetical protein